MIRLDLNPECNAFEMLRSEIDSEPFYGGYVGIQAMNPQQVMFQLEHQHRVSTGENVGASIGKPQTKSVCTTMQKRATRKPQTPPKSTSKQDIIRAPRKPKAPTKQLMEPLPQPNALHFSDEANTDSDDFETATKKKKLQRKPKRSYDKKESSDDSPFELEELTPPKPKPTLTNKPRKKVSEPCERPKELQ